MTLADNRLIFRKTISPAGVGAITERSTTVDVECLGLRLGLYFAIRAIEIT